MFPWIIYINLTFKQKALKVSIYIYIYIYIYGLKNTYNLLKAKIFLFFSEALSMCNQITNENTDNPAT